MESKGLNKKESATLCWDCINAVPNKEKGHGCPWSIDFKPVKGWKAVNTEIAHHSTVTKERKSSKYMIDSYIVKKCPMFAEG